MAEGVFFGDLMALPKIQLRTPGVLFVFTPANHPSRANDIENSEEELSNLSSSHQVELRRSRSRRQQQRHLSQTDLSKFRLFLLASLRQPTMP